MAMYKCNECDIMFDGDWNSPQEDPRDNTALLCTSCHELIVGDNDEVEVKGTIVPFKIPDPMPHIEQLEQNNHKLKKLMQIATELSCELEWGDKVQTLVELFVCNLAQVAFNMDWDVMKEHPEMTIEEFAQIIRTSCGIDQKPLHTVEFPTFVLGDIPIPSDWEETSWHNNICPSWGIPKTNLTVWIDWEKIEDRETNESYRFGITFETPENETKNILNTNSWDQVLVLIATLCISGKYNAH